MRFSRYLRFYIALLSLFFLSQPLHAAESQPWIVDTVSGDVYARQAEQNTGESKNVVPGTVLWAPFEVITGRDGKASLARGTDRIDVSPNSVIQLGADNVEPAGILSQIRLQLGIALFKVDKLPKRGFEVETPFLVSVVKGTTFTVRVGTRAAGASLVEGSLLVMNGSREAGVLIVPGQTAYADSVEQQVHVTNTIDLDSSYEQLMSQVSIDNRGTDGGLADVAGWSLMGSVYAPMNLGGNSGPVDASGLVGGVQQAASGLTGTVDSTAQTLTNTLSDTVLGGALAGLDSGAGQLLGSGSTGGLLGGGEGTSEGITSGVVLPPITLPVPLPLSFP